MLITPLSQLWLISINVIIYKVFFNVSTTIIYFKHFVSNESMLTFSHLFTYPPINWLVLFDSQCYLTVSKPHVNVKQSNVFLFISFLDVTEYWLSYINKISNV